MESPNSLLAGALALALVACGGGGGGGTGPEPPPSSYQISGTITGLNGSLTLSINGDSNQQLNSNGHFQLAGDYADGAQVNLSLSAQPFTQRCNLNHSSLTINGSDISDLVVSCSNIGTLSATVSHYHNGEPVAAAALALYANVDGVAQVVATGTTDPAGQFTFDATGISSDFQLVASASGFVSGQQAVANNEQAPAMNARLQLLPSERQSDDDGQAAIEVSRDGLVLVSLPANSLVDSNGQPWRGAVNVDVAVLDPSADPGLLPGDYRAIAEDGDQPRLIASFGALSVVISAGSGQPLTLAAGAQATLRLPLAERLDGASMAAQVPLYWFDEGRGLWIEEGQASLASSNGRYYYQGEVGHFTLWHSADYLTTTEINGCVETTGQPLAGAEVMAEGRSYIGRSRAVSDDQGQFVLPVGSNAELLLSATRGSQSRTLVTDVGASAITLSDCLQLEPAAATVRLTWGARPHDLNSHLVANLAASSFELSFENPAVSVDGWQFSLDVDDTSGFGPEVITLPSLALAGHYHYVVHLYTGSGSIASSPARVELNLQGQPQLFTPPAGTPNEYWHVFTLVVDEQGEVGLMAQQRWLDDAGYGQLLTAAPQPAP